MLVKQISFRVDASVQMGTGHFMRCLTLADALKQRGSQIRFVSRHLPDHLCNMLKDKGHEFVLLDNTLSDVTLDELAHAQWLGVSQERDASDSIQALADRTWDWLIVDHYALDSRWESMLRKSVKNIMVIDDIADRHHDCDMLLDQNFYADMESRYVGNVPGHCQLLMGPRYALLRDEFRQLHERLEPRSGPVKRVLIFFGGVDVDNYTGRVIEALSEIDVQDFHVDVVIGVQHPCREQIKTACAQSGFACHVQTDKMADLMAAADLAIGAGGGASWERCCLGLPTLVICTADNQSRQIVDAAKKGLLYAPALGKDFVSWVRNHVVALLENDNLRWFICCRSMQVVDGRGVLRVIRNLGCSGIEMREVSVADSPNLFTWRNHPSTRAVSRNKELIEWEDHQTWFASVLCSKDIDLLVGLRGEDFVGVVRFDRQASVAEVSIYLVPDGNNYGRGHDLLLSGEQWIKENRPEVKHIRACVIGGNELSHHLFLGAGYKVEDTHYLKIH
ncbi:MAG: UDP-2,4-diacetamido-2,4,6-trideoxy-beta-L-altropyranose hydrolase [Desulfobulbaceae bacterium]|nr:UDP-2,4-diacetamido-2,4,6-trideoxy-beta-L-altropyranose hydrolase [Desulfobulbaceae bacterium]